MQAEDHARVWQEVRREFLRREAAYRRSGQGVRPGSEEADV
jgi:hypothetical protein